MANNQPLITRNRPRKCGAVREQHRTEYAAQELHSPLNTLLQAGAGRAHGAGLHQRPLDGRKHPGELHRERPQCSEGRRGTRRSPADVGQGVAGDVAILEQLR